MQQFAGVFQTSMADMTSSLLKLFEEQNKQQTAKFDKLVDRVGELPGYPVSYKPPSKRRTHDPWYQDDPPRTRFRLDEAHDYYGDASPHARYRARDAVDPTHFSRRSEVSQREGVAGPRSVIPHGRSSDPPLLHDVRLPTERILDDQVSLEATSMSESDDHDPPPLTNTEAQPSEQDTSATGRTGEFDKWTQEYLQVDTTAPAVNAELADAMNVFAYQELPDTVLKDKYQAQPRPENIKLIVKRTNDFMYSSQNELVPSIRSNDIKMQSLQVPQVKATYAMLQVADRLYQAKNNPADALDLQSCIDQCKYALQLSIHSSENRPDET